MEIKEQYDLTTLNTLGVSARAKYFTEVQSEESLQELFELKEFREHDKLFLGGGSNVLFTKDFDGIVILNKLIGIEIIKETSTDVTIRAMSGVVWHELVLFAVERRYWGIENLSLIPGTVGGAPMQNIGAYGSELKDVLESVEAYHISKGSKRIFTNTECELGYRDSVFKHKLKNQYFISAITITLSKIPQPNISYKILFDYIEEHHIDSTDVRSISNAVSAIRRSKLPDPKVIGNAGSFFKNVFIADTTFQELLKKFPDIKFFKENEKIKIPAAWLIESCGWKGKRVGNVGVHETHALVLVNYGGGTGKEIAELAQAIIDSVVSRFDVTLVPEVNLI